MKQFAIVPVSMVIKKKLSIITKDLFLSNNFRSSFFFYAEVEFLTPNMELNDMWKMADVETMK